MKWILRGILGLILLFITAAVIFGTMLLKFNPNEHKEQIAESVRDATGRTLRIDGDIGVTFFPVLGLNARNAALGNPPGFEDGDFLIVDQVQAGIRLLPLLRRRIELTTITMEKPSITVIRKTNGETNASFKTESDAPAKTDADGKIADLSFDSIEIKNAVLTVINKIDGSATVIDSFNLSVSNFGRGKTTPFKSDLVIKSKEGTKTHLTLSGHVDSGADGKIFTIKNVKSDIRLAGASHQPELKMRMAGNASIDLNSEIVKITDLSFKGDGIDFNGMVDIKGFKKPDLRFNITSPSMQLRQQAAKAEGRAPKNADAGQPPLLPKALLRNFTADGRITIDSLKVGKLTMTDLSIPIVLKKSTLTVAPLAMNFYDGAIETDIRINAQNNAAVYTLDGKADNVQLAKLLNDIKESDYLSGLAKLSFRIESSGDTVQDMRNNAGGELSFNFSDGYINKWNLSKFINQAIAYFEKGDMDQNVPDRIYFTSLKGKFSGESGIFTNDDLLLVAPKSHALGSGTVNLRNSSIDYTLKVGLGDASESKQTHLPIRMEGPLHSIHYALDTKSIVQDLVKDKIQTKKQEFLDKALGQIGENGKNAEKTSLPRESDQENDPKKEILKTFFGRE